MKILTAEEVHEIKASKQFEAVIEGVVTAYQKALFDYVKDKGYQNNYTSKAQEVAYTIGWNKCAKVFPKIS